MTNIIIFGATGNLMIKKLIPALSEIYNKKELVDDFKIYAVSRRDYCTEEYKLYLKEKLDMLTDYSSEITDSFYSLIEYIPIDFEDENDFSNLINHINKIEDINSNYLIYFATAPKYFKILSSNLKKYPLELSENSWKRLIIEKPFGSDLKSALEVNKSLEVAFTPDEIYRIDHYLGKEMIQNIISTRFANRIFEDIWDSDSIESVQIVVSENRGIEDRGAYYDNSGAFRDMIQSHLLQILAVVAMDTPKKFDSRHITREKVRILKNLTEFSKKEIDEDLVIGQYNGYLDEKGVAEGSMTETFVAMKCKIDLKKWKDVPFYLRTGKYMSEKDAHVVIQFKQNSNFNNLWSSTKEAKNLLVFKIQPEEGIYLKINVKESGLSNDLTQVNIDYCHSCNVDSDRIDAYERLFINAIIGDKTLFASWEEIIASWMFIDKLTCDCIDRKNKLIYYDKGSFCPDESYNILGDDEWWRI